jgi:hypothetical protein
VSVAGLAVGRPGAIKRLRRQIEGGTAALERKELVV